MLFSGGTVTKEVDKYTILLIHSEVDKKTVEKAVENGNAIFDEFWLLEVAKNSELFVPKHL